MQLDKTRFKRKIEEKTQQSAALRVLVVDDDPCIVQLLETALTVMDNYEVTSANNASEAIDAIEESKKPFDCLLLDIQMPETDGIVLLRGIRQIPGYEEAPILMLTAMTDRSYVDDAFRAGATDYITKPFDMTELSGRMNAARKLVQERIRAEREHEKALALRSELEQQNFFDFDDPIAISHATNHLRYNEFNNYIDLLSRGRLFNSYSVAVKLREAQNLFAATNSVYFRKALEDAAYCLQITTTDGECMFSYRGGGVFVAVIHGETALREFPTDDRLNTTLRGRRGGQGGTGVQLLTGKPVSMRSLTRLSASAAIERAIENVETRERERMDSAPPPDAMPKPTDVAGEADQGERRRKSLYERVLMELYGSDNYLNLK